MVQASVHGLQSRNKSNAVCFPGLLRCTDLQMSCYNLLFFLRNSKILLLEH